ncbi:MAG: dockerin type I domain-containing protein [Clostridia bacterium]|nr:dockerin type I domain-containing protein [Clostridia bacterium]
MKKIKLLSAVLALLLLLSALPLSVSAADTGYLSDLAFGTASAATNKGNIPLDQTFNSETKEYTVYVKDGQTALYIWATLSTAGTGKTIKCQYTKTTNAAANVSVTSAKATGTSLATLIGKNFTGNTVSVVVGDQTYTVHIVRTASISALSAKVGEVDFAVSGSVSAATTEYTMILPYGAKPIINVTPTTASGTTVTVNGQPAGTQIDLSWSADRTATVEIAVFKTGAESTTKTIYTVTVVAPTVSGVSGSGTKEDPFSIQTAADMVALSTAVADGQTFKNFYFLLENDVTLPNDWTPIGTSTTKYPFSGDFDGGNHLITIPNGGKAPFGATVEAVLHDFDVFGAEINGTAVVDIYTTGASGKTAVTIENVTLKSGSSTLKSGFIGGYSHGNAPIYINNCVVESNVIIGYDRSQKWVGSFGGELNGAVKNCVSFATVYGTDFVGGIVADKGQTMGEFTVENCNFYGTVEASGNYVGGIVGCGYAGTSFGMASAPNAPCTTIINCFSDADVKGANYVGGILGGEGATYQCWDNGIGQIKNNTFCGTVTATAENAYIGGVVGYFAGLDKCNVIENNTYTDNCGAQNGIGFAAYVDTSCADHETLSGANYLNSGDASTPLPSFKAGTGQWDPSCFTKRNLNRTDDPLGSDAEKLARMVAAPLKNDVNGDDTVDVRDLVRLKKMSAQMTEATHAADLDKSGTVDALDVAMLVQFLLLK